MSSTGTVEFENEKCDVTFSIVIPAYNCSHYIRDTVNSILKQSYQMFEIIIVDDGSTDDTLSTCRSIERLDSRIKVFSKKNGGPFSARLYAYNYMSGDYVLHLDSDDMLRTDALEVLSILIGKHIPDVVLFEKTTNKEFKRTEKLFPFKSGRYFTDCDKTRLLNLALDTYALNSISTKAVRATTLRNICFPDEMMHLIVGEDLVQSLYVLQAVNDAVYTSEPLYYYRLNEEGTTRTYRKSDYSDALVCTLLIRRLVSDWQNLPGCTLTLEGCQKYFLIRTYRVIQGAWESGSADDRKTVLDSIFRDGSVACCYSNSSVARSLRIDMRFVFKAISNNHLRVAWSAMCILEFIRKLKKSLKI